jgi:hypothetical protein
MPEVATPNQAEREFETGTDESFKNTNATGGAKDESRHGARLPGR